MTRVMFQNCMNISEISFSNNESCDCIWNSLLFKYTVMLDVKYVRFYALNVNSEFVHINEIVFKRIQTLGTPEKAKLNLK